MHRGRRVTGVGSPVVGIGSFAIKDKRKLSKGYAFLREERKEGGEEGRVQADSQLERKRTKTR